MTRAILLIMALLPGATAAIQRQPAACSSRPCTYVLKCAAKDCNATEIAELRSVLAEAHRGDTIELEAGRIWTAGSSHFTLTARPGTSGYLTITSTEADRLPLPGTRITPAYAPLMPTLRTSVTNKAALALAGNDQPVTHVRLRGLRFDVSPTATRLTSFSRGPLLIGWSSPDDYGGFVVTSPSQLPDQIIVQHCLFEQDWLHQVGRMIRLNGRGVEIRDSFIEGGQAFGADAQAISGSNTKGPYTIENNYIDGSSENLMFGGGMPAFDDELDSAVIRYNYFPHLRERHHFATWAPGLSVFKGRVIRPRFLSGHTYIALNTGSTGAVEPAWPTTAGGKVVDNGITWERVGSTAKWVVKNNLEIKSGKNVLIRYNVFDGMWPDGQETAINFKAENENTAQSQCNANWPSCYGARTLGIQFVSNIVRDWSQALKLVGGTMGVPSAVGDYVVRNNLFDQAGAVWPGYRSISILATTEAGTGKAMGFAGVVFENNTVITSAPNSSAITISAVPFSGARVRNNIIPRGSSGVKASGLGEGRATLEATICGGESCKPDQWDKNIIVGAARSMYPNTTLNLCPGTSSCAEDPDFEDPQNGKLFENLPRRRYLIRQRHMLAKRNDSKGADIGADLSDLPEIRELEVAASDRKALFSYAVTAPIAHIPCVIQVSTATDLSTTVPDLDPAQFLRPDTDSHERVVANGLRRTLIAGNNVALSPDTVYWYRLQCGGDTRRGSFRTAPAQSGTVEVSFSRPATSSAAVAVEYGYSYSRSQDTIQAAETTPELTCAPGASCTVTAMAPKGAIIYYRWRIAGRPDGVQLTIAR